ncbi:MAG: metalloregulator ArsR/SmtB family transcription factor [Deltaproteobacteria bacterium]|jgi:ArsR family transcriptional regulator|nr:metalloregulator ArsR/SmtB family transcription factor [Deltaproteobacteria bacterium]
MEQTLHFFKALSDETRLRLLFILNRYELNVNELVRFLGMGQSRVSRHLKILAEAGLLSSRRDGLWVFYSAAREGSGREFINAIAPFLLDEKTSEGDLNLAAALIDERASKTTQFFNSIAMYWDNMSREILGGFQLEEAVVSLMPEACETAVDLGCGTGLMLEQLMRRAQNVVGVDGSASMLELARRRFVECAERVSLRIGDLEHLPLRDGEADFVCVNLVLHHLSHPRNVLEEGKRVLKPGGVLVLSDFDSHDDESLRSDYGDRWLGFETETIHAFLEQAGLSLESSFSRPVEKNLSLHFYKATNKS